MLSFFYIIVSSGKKTFITWPVGQAVKTPPFHGGNTGSIPVRVTFIFKKTAKKIIFIFLKKSW